MRRKIKASVSLLLALMFIIFGFIGLALPVVPQTIFFVIGIILLTFVIPGFGDYIEKKLRKTPHLLKIYHTHRAKFEKYFG